MDIFSKEKRSEIMGLVKGSRNKSTELALINFFTKNKIKGWRRNSKLFGRPDFVFPKNRIVVFVDGCFWHGHHCRNIVPKKNREFWEQKISKNKQRDKDVTRRLILDGWKVMRIKECELNKVSSLKLKFKKLLKPSGEIKMSAIDLFCGIGGLSYGLKKSGIPVVAGVDFDESCQYAFEKNIKAKFISNDISKINGTELKKEYWKDNKIIKILVGCAPCQPFSSHANKIKNKKNTKRWRLLNDFIRLIQQTKPDIVSMENVPNLSNQKIFKDFISSLTGMNYHVSYSNVYCPNFGIPQKRRRLVLIASRFGEIKIIQNTHEPKNYLSTRTAIGKLPRIKAGDISKTDSLHRTTKLSEINLKRIKASKPNGTWLDWEKKLRLTCHKKKSGNTYQSVYGRMSWDEPSPTITTQFYNYGTGRFGHPSQNRAITIREAALLQSFPTNYKFIKKEEDIYITKLGTQIGNAVPPLLGLAIGKTIKQHLKKYNAI